MFYSMSLVTGLFVTLVLIGWGLGIFEKQIVEIIRKPTVIDGGQFNWEQQPRIDLDDPPVAGGGGGRPVAPVLPVMVIPVAVADSMSDDSDDILIPTREELGLIVDYGNHDGEPGEGTDTGSGVTGFGGSGYGTEGIPEPDEFIIYQVEPKMITEIPPEYPRFARRAGLEGDVWLQVLIDTEGKVIRAEILRSSKIQALDEAALAVAWKNQFAPGIQNDHAVPCWVKYRVEFKLDR
jgi:TonB family protein